MSLYALTASDVVIRVADGAYIPNDPENLDRALYNTWVAAGNTPDPYVPPAAVIQSVTPRQARLALLSAGLLDAVETMVNQAGGSTKITWSYATVINRDDPLIATLSVGLGLSSAQIDALFLVASTL